MVPGPPSNADRTDVGVVILNPACGDGSHREQVRALAAEHGLDVVETSEAGDAVEHARRAAERGVELVVAAGGDGTVNEVVRGIDAAEAFDRVALGVVPAGTGNNFATNIGVTSIPHGFEVATGGETRRIDLGVAAGRPFVNSCVGGLTAESSSRTPAESKERFGVLAYVLTTLRTMTDFEGLDLVLADADDDEPLWAGEALVVMVGNARRFTDERAAQADVEDGLFDVTIVESMPPAELLEEAAVYRLFGRESDHVVHCLTSGLTIEVLGDPASFSLDGEVVTTDTLPVEMRPRTLAVRVGPGYDSDPDD